MEPKNVMLLGFVNKALDYLNKHIGEDLSDSLTQLKDIDLESLKKELGEELKEVSEKASSTAKELIAAGYEAFDKFVNADKKEEEKKDLSKQFDDLFNVDFDEEEKEEKDTVEQKEELEDLLSFYNLDAALDLNEEDFEEEEEQIAEDETDSSEETPIPYSDTLTEAEEEIPYPLDEEETEMFELIARNVNRKDDQRSKDILSGANKELDSIFSELVAAENTKEEKEDVYESSMINRIQELSIPSVLQSYDEALKDQEAAEEVKQDEEAAVPEEAIRIIENPLVDVSLKQDKEKEEEIVKELEKKEEEERSHLVFPEQVDKDDIIKLMKDIQPLSDVYYNKIENFINETEKEEQERAKAEETAAPVADKKEDDSYISSLIDDLKSKLDEEEIKKRKEEEEFKEIYEKIHKAYPYLSGAFIRNVYDLKQQIADEYPIGETIVILHRTSFKNVENLRQYVEITLNHGYAINADEKQMIVDAFKQHVNTDGKVITSIFEVANQSALLSGEYEGYRVLFEDDLK
ncbi:MAG: hypothetical protein K5648_10545 [Erysipelotrichaceae bacterium]|nr:hypothetical protein [Erysipelotrichaceae bacterium]